MMEIEFAGSELTITGMDGRSMQMKGNDLLKGFEIVNIDPVSDIRALVCWTLEVHVLSIIYLLWYKRRTRRAFVYSD